MIAQKQKLGLPGPLRVLLKRSQRRAELPLPRNSVRTLAACVLVASSLSALEGGAQTFVSPLPLRPYTLKPVGVTYIRGIRYNDHTLNTTMAPTAVPGGGFFTINCRSLLFSGVPGANRYDIRVIIQDTALPPNSGGVTAYRLTNVRPQGTVLTVQAPTAPVLLGRSYHVTVFLIGPQPMHYCYAGVLQLL